MICITKITKEDIQELLAKATGYEVVDIPPMDDEEWHLRVKYPYEHNGVFDSVHAVLQKDKTIIISKFKSIDFSEDANIKDIKKYIVSELSKPIKKAKEVRK